MNLAPRDVQVLIPVGGFGTRLQSVLPDLPKPMAPIQNKPFLEWLVSFLKLQGFTKITLLTGYKASTIRDYFQDGSKFGVRINYSHEESPLGTGGAVAQAMHGLKSEHYLVVNGDTLFCLDLNDFLKNSKAPISMALNQVNDVSRYGSVKLSTDGLVTEFIEKKAGLSAGLINAGVYYLNSSVKEFFKTSSFSLEKEVFEPLAKQNKITGVSYTADFIDIGIPESYSESQKLVPAWISSLSR